ncbi:MAG: cbb3-type cytochrome c oxidase subunit II [Verrucomicrobiota bacterium]|nr:cbb3-type cytochrome c oxidase subunit II [Verrucomicrobiota bacterium]
MKNLPIIFCGIFFILAFSWVGVILSTHSQFGSLQPTSSQLLNAETLEPVDGMNYTDAQAKVVPAVNNLDDVQYPMALVGKAQRGREAYISLGCLYCHSQQVRRKGFGSDFERNWGSRQSVPRDYIRQERVLLGSMRTGPDLMTIGQRNIDESWYLLNLYNPQINSEGSNMPPYAFLFEKHKIDPLLGPSPKALKLPAKYAIESGYEVLPTERAEALVAYLLSLKLDYELPEAKFSQ